MWYNYWDKGLWSPLWEMLREAQLLRAWSTCFL